MFVSLDEYNLKLASDASYIFDDVEGSPLVALEGLIGAGKSTLLKKMRAKHRIRTFSEPVHEWKYLNAYYKNPEVYAVLLQNEILASHFENPPVGTCLAERSSDSGVEVFARMLVGSGHITRPEYLSLKQRQSLLKQPDAIVYLIADIDWCMDNIVDRDGPGDALITREYLVALEAAYRAYLAKKRAQGVPILRIAVGPGSVPEEDRIQRIAQWIAMGCPSMY